MYLHVKFVNSACKILIIGAGGLGMGLKESTLIAAFIAQTFGVQSVLNCTCVIEKVQTACAKYCLLRFIYA
jgi:hypothetical protein